MNYVLIENTQLLLLLGIMVYHFITDEKRSNAFIIVFSCFILNAILLIGFNYTYKKNNEFLFLGNFLGLLGFIVILLHLIKSKKFRLSISKYFMLISITLLIDCIVIYYYLKIMASLNIYISHTELSVFYPVIELILISVILFYYLANNNNLKISLLVISMFCFFLSGVAQICQFLFFINNQQKALIILDVGLYIFAVYLLYKYFTDNENEPAKLY